MTLNASWLAVYSTQGKPVDHIKSWTEHYICHYWKSTTMDDVHFITCALHSRKQQDYILANLYAMDFVHYLKREQAGHFIQWIYVHSQSLHVS